MEYPKILGRHFENPEVIFELRVPRTFEPIDLEYNEQKTLDDSLHKEIQNKLFTEFSLVGNIKPNRNRSLFGTNISDYVNLKLSSCPLPRNQGPIIPGVDNSKYDYRGEHLILKVSWLHNPPPIGTPKICATWSPREKSDGNIFPEYNVVPFDSSNNKIKGPYSDSADMAIVYTCSRYKCSIKCTCKICSSDRQDCRRKCSFRPCSVCTLQCPRHKIELDRKFEQEIHAFTLKVDEKDTLKFVVKHAGIPTDCIDCADDLRDHQIFHKIFHVFCKFCRQLLIPFSLGNITKIEDFVGANNKAMKQSLLTCKECNKIFNDNYSRKRHESTVHENHGKFDCSMCDRKFANINEMEYHMKAKHTITNDVLMCQECDQTFKNEMTLKRHISSKHSGVAQEFACEYCDAVFSRRDSLTRHHKERHWDHKVNWNHVQFGEDLMLKCDMCNKLFKRNENLKVHKQMVHKEDFKQGEQHTCLFCFKNFSNKI